jgi:hypothetical protein
MNREDSGKKSRKERKHEILELLSSDDLQGALDTLCRIPARQVVNTLFSLLLSTEPGPRWAAITAFGVVVANLAERDMESARVIMRRLMWQLNDESGGIGWGCPEAMAEVVARNEDLGQEFAEVLISYIREDGNFLEYEPLQQGALWGIGRVAQVKPELVQAAAKHLRPFLDSADPIIRGLAAWATGLLGASEARARLKELSADSRRLWIYRDLQLKSCHVKDLVEEALAKLEPALV